METKMISLNYKSSTEFNKLNETVPELFRLSAKVQLAETISFLNPIPEDSIQVIINSCLALLPNRRYLNVEANDEHLCHILDHNPTLMSSLVSIRSQESVIALSHLYKCSNGVIGEKAILILIAFIKYLTYSDFTAPSDIVHATNFTFYLIRQLAALTHVADSDDNQPTSARGMIMPAFIDFFSHIVQSNNVPILYGTLMALGEPTHFNYQQDELSRVIGIIENILSNISTQIPISSPSTLKKSVNSTTNNNINNSNKLNQKKCLLLICKSFEQITHLSTDQVESETYRRLYNLVFHYTTTITDNETFISIINVIVRCGISDASIGKEVMDYTIRFVQETKNLNNSEVLVSLNRPHSELLYTTILTSLVDLCDRYSEKSIRVIEVLKEFIQHSRIPKNNNNVRLTVFDSVCRILKNEHRREHGIEICKTVISSLINTMHIQYSEYSISLMATTANNVGPDGRNRSPSVISTQAAEQQFDALSNIITCLGRIACMLNDQHVIDMILPNFMSRVTYPPTFIENLVLEQLTEIALLGYASVTKDIVVLITKLFKKICRDPHQGLIRNITPNALQRLAKDLSSQELRQDLCKRVLKLFQQLGKTLKREELNQKLASPVLKGMGFLLPTIAELIKVPIGGNVSNSGNNSNSSSFTALLNSTEVSNMRLFRSIWFYCVLFRFSTPGTWRSDWRECVQVIASHLLPLISTKSHLHLEMELELDSIIKQGFDKEYFVELRSRLLEVLPNHAHVIKNLTFAQAAYVYSVYTLETMRFSMSHSFKVVFAYLQDQSIESIYVNACIRGIVDKVFNDFVTTYLCVSPASCERVLSDHASFLLLKFCYPYQPVRKASDESISSLVARFPQILWNRECLGTLLDLIEAIGQAAKVKPMDMISIKLPSVDYVIELPDETPARHRLLQEVVELGNVWLKNGAQVAPIEIQEQLQEYMQRFSTFSRNHIGFSLAVEIGSINNTSIGNGLNGVNGIIGTSPQPAHSNIASAAASAIGSRFTGNSNNQDVLASAYPICYNSNAANFISTLQLKSLYSGEVNGMINMMMVDYNENSGEQEDEKLSEIVEELAFLRLIEEFEKLIQQHRRGKIVDSLAFSSIMYRSCAFLINHYFGQSVKLIHMVCYAPAFIFTPNSMEVGVTAWKWLLAERPDLTQFIMTSISDIWSWTVNQRIGLFTNTERDPSPFSISQQQQQPTQSQSQSQPSATQKDSNEPNIDVMMGGTPVEQKKNVGNLPERHNHVPHKIMINFLEERFYVVKYSSKEQVDVIISMLLKAIADQNMLSVSPRSLGTRFKLLLLCMRFIQGDYIGDQTLVKLMRDRVYLAALSWFYLPPIWYGQNESSGDLQADTHTLIDFCKALQTEPIFSYAIEKRHTISFSRDKNTGSLINSSQSINGYSTIRNSRPSSDRLNLLANSSNVSGSAIPSLTNAVPSSQSNGSNHVGSGLSGAVGIGLAQQQHQQQQQQLQQQQLQQSSNTMNGSTAALASSVGSSTPGTIKLDVIGSGIGTMTVSSAQGILVSQTLLETCKSGERPLNELQLEELRKRRNLILLLVGNELERMSAWNNPINRLTLQIQEQLKFSYDNLPKNMKSSWREYLVSSWRIDPRLAVHFSARFQLAKIRRILSEMVVKNTKAVLNIPEALPLLITEENVARNIPELKYLLYWETVTPPMAISLLAKSFRSHPLVIQYACRVLRNFPPETIMFYIPQLVQALRYDRTGLVENYLVAASKTSELLAHQIIWNVQTYTEADPNTDKLIDDPGIHDIAKRLKNRIIGEMDAKARDNYKREFDYFESFTAISGRLLREHKDPIKRKTQLHEELRILSNNQREDPNNPLYLPTNPKSIVIGLDIDSAMTLQSAAKVPILVNFKVLERRLPSSHPSHLEVKSPSPSNSPLMGATITSSTTAIIPSILKSTSPKLSNTNIMHLRESTRIRKLSRRVIHDPTPPSNEVHLQGCIFKSGDDIRQDMLALQVIDLFKRIFQSVGLDLYLFPYKVIATKPGCGMIELVPNTMSRDQIGKKVNGSLYDYFISRYGQKNSLGFQNARRNFIKSMAAYSVVSYILQIKDRHNANILVDDEGHIVHIDFGFIFDISPGGDLLTFEASPFKMNQEMIDIMGGKPNAEQFTWFMEQSVRAFLAARQHMDSIITLVELMLDTKLPCFKEQTILHLRQRFCPNKSETYAAKFMTKVVVDSFSTISTFSTYFYDVFQYFDNGIEM
ncbi:phosphatidylinositol 4-kinase [Cavenderia fasciculata]|uniref:1-phosphatidylinositol 4-kinase n=1 Tax=Cavenderia fasciculata TaxID=261658 RepID=F4Q471_CACFS|nr:phosphatidylinositol 4-kinase [Cavenderia fasciculata]EGG17773.1 phosphatidylinositol 4-kinase [Cavenderia fasciculata]|eukprot:XP_004356257.1 phosphatidylinositol 4-kinase [Cavenderia fasciculata]